MIMKNAISDFSGALASILLGSLAAPTIYIFIGFAAPAGMHDFRAANLSTLLTVFCVGWFFSILVTSIVGGALWTVLHDRKHDGFLSYAFIAGALYLALWLVVGGGSPPWLGLGMSTSNAVAVRSIERLFAKRKTTKQWS